MNKASCGSWADPHHKRFPLCNKRQMLGTSIVSHQSERSVDGGFYFQDFTLGKSDLMCVTDSASAPQFHSKLLGAIELCFCANLQTVIMQSVNTVCKTK